MQLSSALDIDKVLQNETILTLQGRRLDPISALRQTDDIFNCSGALLPPDNAAFRLVWFTGREHRYHNRIYIRFEYPIPDPLRADVAWDRSRLLGDLERQILGHVIFPLSLCVFSFQADFLFFSN